MGRRRRSRPGGPSGVLIVDKPTGVTSFDVVKVVRRHLKAGRAGHTGTLDPLATGVLPVCVGEATKVAGLLTAEDKEYVGTGQLGIETDTLDTTGEVTARRDVGPVALGGLEQVLGGLVGRQLQTPPAYSAVRVEGRRAHERARRGESVAIEPRPIEVFELELLEQRGSEFRIRLVCSKGTYVRSLVAEVGRRLGCGAALSALRRVRSGPFSLAVAVPLDRVRQEGEAVELLGVDRALSHLPVLDVDADEADRLRHGQPLPDSYRVEGGEAIRLRSRGNLVAVGETRQGQVWPRRVFLERHPAHVDKPAHMDHDGL